MRWTIVVGFLIAFFETSINCHAQWSNFNEPSTVTDTIHHSKMIWAKPVLINPDRDEYGYWVDNAKYIIPPRELQHRPAIPFFLNYGFNYNFWFQYDSLHPKHRTYYFNKIFFNLSPSELCSTIGLVYFIGKNYCDFQYYSSETQSLIQSRQAISKEDIKTFQIQIGKAFKVTYCNYDPRISIIDFQFPGKVVDPKINKIFYPQIEGYSLELEVESFLSGLTSINNYRKLYGQPLIFAYTPLIGVGLSRIYTNGITFSLRGALNTNIQEGGFNFGYLMPISNVNYVHYSIQFGWYNQTMKGFGTNEVKSPPDSSVFQNSFFTIQPKMEFWLRQNNDNIYGSQIWKFGIGFSINMKGPIKWIYSTGTSSGNTSAQTLNDIPSLPSIMPVISLSYSGLTFVHPKSKTQIY